MRLIFRFCRVAVLLSMAAVGGASALAQAPASYPQRPITIVVGYPPGGSTDLVARTLGQALAGRLGQPVVIENAGGAGGSIGAQKVASASADGYTLLVGANNEIAINALVKKSVRYTTQDFTPIGLIASQPLVLAASPASGIRTVDDFIRAAKAKPGELNYGSSGVGTALHVAGEMIKQQAGISLTHIPYRGTGAITTDLIGGNLEFGMYVLSSALPLIKSGKIMPIGTTEQKRAAATPDIPALSESPTLAGVDVGVWFMLLAPANLPGPIVTKLQSALAEVLKSLDFRKRLEDSGSVVPATQPDLQKFLADEIAKFEKIVTFAGIKDE